METARALVSASVARLKVYASAPRRHLPAATRLVVAALIVSERPRTQGANALADASVARQRAPVYVGGGDVSRWSPGLD